MAFDIFIEPASGSIEITGSSLTFIGEKSGSLLQIQQSSASNLLVAGDVSASGNIYANSFAHSLFSGGKRSTTIPQDAVTAGVYWQSLGSEEITTTQNPLYWNDIETEVPISDNDNLYISWAFFEEEILNRELGFLPGDESFFGGHFSSKESFITRDDNLISRQKISQLYSRKKTGLRFLYPDEWDKSYNTINHKL